MTTSPLDRARLLLSQGRHESAEGLLREALADDPDSAEAHYLLAWCLVRAGRGAEATDEAERAVHLLPDWAAAHQLLGSVWLDRGHDDRAEASLLEALALDPQDADTLGTLAALRFGQGRWADALARAQEGLAVDPDDDRCANYRSLALEKLGRGGEAIEAARQTLRRDPENATTHATLGWAQLHQGEFHDARESFREALRLDPGLGLARDGMVRALNGRSFLFRLVFKFYSAMARLSAGNRWGVIIALLVAQRVLRTVARQSPEWRPLIYAALAALFGFVLLTWIANPLYNTFLRFNTYGRYLLDEDERKASNVLAATIGLGLTAALASAAFLDLTWGGLWLGYTVIMLVPVSGTFHCPPGWPRLLMGGVAAGLGVLGAWTLLEPLVNRAAHPERVAYFFVGTFLSQFLANALSGVKVRS